MLLKPYRYALCTFLLLLCWSEIAIAKVNFQRFKTPAGIQVFFVPDTTTPFVSVHFAYKDMGSARDPKDQEGLGYLLLNLIKRSPIDGLNKFDRYKKIHALGALSGIGTHLSKDHLLTHFKCPKENLGTLLTLAARLQNNPDLSQSEFEILKMYNPHSSHVVSADEISFAQKILYKKYFQNHPYAFPIDGSLETQQMITLNDLKKAQKTRFAKNDLVFAVVGDLKPKAIAQLIDNAFGKQPEQNNDPKVSKRIPQFKGETLLIQKDTPQSGVIFAQNAPGINDPDYFAFSILNQILGRQPFTSRLWQRIREEKGLVYDIGTRSQQLQQTHFLVGVFRADNQNVNTVIDFIKAEWKKIKTTGVTQAEFEAAKQGIMGSWVLQLASSEGIADTILSLYLSDLDINYINIRNTFYEKVTLEQVNAVAKKYLNPEQLSFIIVGNPE